MTKIFQLIGLAIEIGGAVTEVEALISIAKPLTGSQLQTILQPSIDTLHQVYPKFNPPKALLTDILNASADAINKYVLHLTTE